MNKQKKNEYGFEREQLMPLFSLQARDASISHTVTRQIASSKHFQMLCRLHRTMQSFAEIRMF